jgi:hypothetical protein
LLLDSYDQNNDEDVKEIFVEKAITNVEKVIANRVAIYVLELINKPEYFQHFYLIFT